MFDILLQNNASKEIHILKGLTNVSESHLYLDFKDVEMPMEVKDGEYTYAVIYNEREDVTYEVNTILMNTLVKTDEGSVILADLKPITGLLRVGDIESITNYPKDENKKVYYYKG